MSGPARWAVSPTDHRTHSLLPEDDHPPGALQARCGHLLPLSVVRHECLPGRLLCVTCMWCCLVPVSVFPRQIPAGRRAPICPVSALQALDGQPVADVADVALLDHGQHVKGMEAGR